MARVLKPARFTPLEAIALCALDCARTHGRSLFPFGSQEGRYGVWVRKDWALAVGTLQDYRSDTGITANTDGELIALLVANWEPLFTGERDETS